MVNDTSTKAGTIVAFVSTVLGSIMPIALSEMPQGIIIQKGAFLCAEDSVDIKMKLNKK